MLRLLLCLLVTVAGCTTRPPEPVRPGPPRLAAFGDAVRQNASGPGRADGPSPCDGRLAWVSDRGPETRILCVAEGERKRPQELTAAGTRVADPAWSPDGNSIACAVLEDGVFQIYVLTPDGKTRRRLTSGREGSRHPSWSPNGRRIAIEVQGASGSAVWIVEPDSSDLTFVSEGICPAWSPDGMRLAFQQGAPGTICTIRPDGSGLMRLTSGRDARQPSWSPDSRWIVFAQYNADRADDLWAVSNDGSRTVRITWDPAPEWSPSWAKDGRVFFVADRNGEQAIWAVSASNPEILK